MTQESYSSDSITGREGFTSADALQALTKEPSGLEAFDPATLERVRTHARFHFILADHIDEQAPQISAAIPPAKLLAIEMYGGAPGDRQDEANYINKKLAEPPEAEPYTLAEDPYLENIVNSVKGKVDEVRFIDADESHIEIQRSKQRSDEANETWHEQLNAHSPNSDIEAALSEAITLRGHWLKDRDTLVTHQIVELAAERITDQPVDVDIIQGGTHTGVQHRLARTQFQTSRVFIPDDEPSAPEKIHFNYLSQARREVALDIPGAPQPELVKKLHLSTLYGKASQAPDFIETEIIGRMSDQEIQTLLDQVDEIKQAATPDNSADIDQKIKTLLLQNAEHVQDT